MRKTAYFCMVVTSIGLWMGCAHNTEKVAVTLNVAEKGAPVSPSMYGVFFEEINHAGDGGLYAELVQNRSFEEKEMPEGYYVEHGHLKPAPVKHHQSGQVNNGASFLWNNDPVRAWSLLPEDENIAKMRLTKERPMFETAPNNLEVTIRKADEPVQLINEGYWGMNIEQGKKYTLRTIIRKASDYTGTITAKLLSMDGTVIGQTSIDMATDGTWSDRTNIIEPTASDPKARLALEFDATGKIWLDYVSLFPPTFNNRENGMRPDVAQCLADLKPAFFRWPGGCVVEGISLANRFEWKKTLGDPAARPGEYSTWGYRCSYGMGYHETLQYCEDIGAKMMFVCNVGLACQLRMGDASADSEIPFYLDDCMDAIEYAIGGTDTEWGALRAKNGHAEPFPLQYVEIGNENWGAEYDRRFDIFYKAIKEKYPQLTLIYDDMSGLREENRGIEKTDMIDPHWYVTPDFFYRNTTMFDTKQRGKWNVYVGEYACNQGVGGGNMNAALSEAAFISGMERNGDLVTMTSYAPLFENVHNREWSTNLIWIDTDKVMGRTSYYVQKMYSENRPTYNIASSVSTLSHDSLEYNHGSIGLGVWDTEADYKDIRITENGKTSTLPDMPKVTEVLSKLYENTYGNNYTMELKARKNRGSEGFLIYFGMSKDGKLGYRFNIGGWGNHTTALQQLSAQGDQVISRNISHHIETGRWYDIRIEITPHEAKLYVDNQLVLSNELQPLPQKFLTSGYDENTGEVIIKFVNSANTDQVIDFTLDGVTHVASDGQAITLQADDLNDENSMDNPQKIVPVEKDFNRFGKTFSYKFPKYSFTILRLKAK
ncbi:MAG: alpha-L-arabinofuranosidase [Bacteroidaceae bacterium]|nr:alpha-L-arabinofuranosidase [Bacteroidaceae bacterium]